MNNADSRAFLDIKFFVQHAKALYVGLVKELFSRARELDDDEKRKVEENDSDQ